MKVILEKVNKLYQIEKEVSKTLHWLKTFKKIFLSANET